MSEGLPRQRRAADGPAGSLTVWETADQAEAANATAAGWMSDSGFELTPRELHIGEVVLSTTLEVRAPAPV